RLLHNFVASALTVVDHTRVMYRELYSEANIFPEYQLEVDRRFVKDPLIQFVQKLRHLAQHVRLPDVSYIVSGDMSDFGRRLLLRKSDLLEFSGWNAPAQKFLDSAPDEIDLADVVQKYQEKIRTFYKWMVTRQQEIHSSDIERVEKVQEEMR